MISKFKDLDVHFKSMGLGWEPKPCSRIGGAFYSLLIIAAGIIMDSWEQMVEACMLAYTQKNNQIKRILLIKNISHSINPNLQF